MTPTTPETSTVTQQPPICNKTSALVDICRPFVRTDLEPPTPDITPTINGPVPTTRLLGGQATLEGVPEKITLEGVV